ncbi:MAG TPA: HAD family phosphatase [Actinomycetota bacterium]
MPIRAVVFDIGGVLESTPSTGWVGVWEARIGLRAGELGERTADLWAAGSLGTMSEAEVRRGAAERLGLDEGAADALMADIWDEYLGTLNVELAKFVRGLRPRYRTAIISNSFVGAREREQERYGLEDIADVIVYSHEVGISKPEPRIYLLACERLGVKPEESIFVDDVEENVDAARIVGMHGVLFLDTSQAIADIEALLSTR